MPRTSRFRRLEERCGHISDAPSIIPAMNTPSNASRIRLGVVLDPIEDIKYAKDSTLARLLAAQARNFELVYMEQNDLSLRDGKAFARMRPLSVRADAAGWFNLGEPKVAPLQGSVDVVLMRKD